jgi:hypothetical protein
LCGGFDSSVKAVINEVIRRWTGATSAKYRKLCQQGRAPA